MLARIKHTTMACWWPSRYNLARLIKPDWLGIAGELAALLDGERYRLGMGASTPEYIAELEEMLAYARKQAGR